MTNFVSCCVVAGFQPAVVGLGVHPRALPLGCVVKGFQPANYKAESL